MVPSEDIGQEIQHLGNTADLRQLHPIQGKNLELLQKIGAVGLTEAQLEDFRNLLTNAGVALPPSIPEAVKQFQARPFSPST
jgi:hypothetical protein